MKLLFSLSILVLVSCASNRPVEPETPQFWQDEYGIVHRSHVSPSEVAGVKVVMDEPPAGCRRLRDFLIEGRAGDWEIKTAAAKQGATHIIWRRINGYKDTLGLPYDCKNFRQVSNQWEMQKLYMKRRAMDELERRRRERGEEMKLTPVANPYQKPDWVKGF